MNANFWQRASLGLNVVLAVVVVVLVLHKLNRASATAPGVVNAPKAVNKVTQTKITNVIGATPMVGGTKQLTEQAKLLQYTDIESASTRRRLIIDRLRALGVPNDMLALVAQVDFEAQWDSRFEECWGDMEKMAAVQLEMDLAKDAEMRAALGEEGFKQWDLKRMLWEAMSTEVEVTPSEAEAIYALKKKLQQRLLQLEHARLNRTMDDTEINDAIDKAYSEFNEQVRAVLGEYRYAVSQQLDEGFAADILRHELTKAKVNLTDTQFQELFRAEQEWTKARSRLDQQFQNNMSSPDYLKQARALDEARDRAFERVLGSNAFYALRKEQDPLYSQMKKFQAVWGLNEEKIDYVYRTMKQYQKNVEDYQAQVLELQTKGQHVDWEVVFKNLQQSAHQTQEALQNYLGQDSFNKLQRNHVLRWATVGFQPLPGKDGTESAP